MECTSSVCLPVNWLESGVENINNMKRTENRCRAATECRGFHFTYVNLLYLDLTACGCWSTSLVCANIFREKISYERAREGTTFILVSTQLHEDTIHDFYKQSLRKQRMERADTLL